MRALFAELLAHGLADQQPAGRRAAEEFVALFDSEAPLAAEESIQIRSTPDGELVVDIAGELKPAPKNPKIVRAIWNGLLGTNGAADLKKGLVEGIDRLAR